MFYRFHVHLKFATSFVLKENDLKKSINLRMLRNISMESAKFPIRTELCFSAVGRIYACVMMIMMKYKLFMKTRTKFVHLITQGHVFASCNSYSPFVCERRDGEGARYIITL